MKVLVVGAGAREHALAWRCAQSELVERVLVAPGNGGTVGVARNVPVAADDVPHLVRLVAEEKVGLTVLGPEAAVAAGVGDALRDAGCLVFGPSRAAGRIETSKAFAKALMKDAGIPTAAFEAFQDPEAARRWARERGGQVAVKADGLAQGKGVTVCSRPEESDAAIEQALVKKSFGEAGRTLVLEERLTGPELSVFAFTDGEGVVGLVPARDYKRAEEGDKGPNTGGMGAFSPPADAGPEVVSGILKTVIEPAVKALVERGSPYQGVLYAGLMLTSQGPKCIEFNARFGDPEAQVILPRLESDLVPYLLACARGGLTDLPEPRWSPRPAVGIVVAASGYPGRYETGMPVKGLADLPSGAVAFHAGTRFEPGRGLVTSGGRVVTVVGRGDDVEEARTRALEAAGRVAFRGSYFRRDIAL